MGEVDSFQEFVDYLKGSTTFWVIGGFFVLLALLALFGGGRR